MSLPSFCWVDTSADVERHEEVVQSIDGFPPSSMGDRNETTKGRGTDHLTGFPAKESVLAQRQESIEHREMLRLTERETL